MGLLPDAIYPSRIARAREVPGWMDEFELLWLTDQAAKCCRIVEVGSWKGRSTVALAENTPGVVFAVDTWLGAPEIPKEEVGPPGWLFQQFQDNTKGLPIIPIQLESTRAAEFFKRGDFGQFDMIFIDAAHDYESVKADIQAWQPLLKAGGIFSGHDFTVFPGVAKAVTELLGKVRLPAYSIWLKEGD